MKQVVTRGEVSLITNLVHRDVVHVPLTVETKDARTIDQATRFAAQHDAIFVRCLRLVKDPLHDGIGHYLRGSGRNGEGNRGHSCQKAINPDHVVSAAQHQLQKAKGARRWVVRRENSGWHRSEPGASGDPHRGRPTRQERSTRRRLIAWSNDITAAASRTGNSKIDEPPMRMFSQGERRSCGGLLLLISLLVAVRSAEAYSVLTHEALVDLSWESTVTPMLLSRFPSLTPEQLIEAHAYAYGGVCHSRPRLLPVRERFFLGSDALCTLRRFCSEPLSPRPQRG